jgi:hypothetical protein
MIAGAVGREIPKIVIAKMIIGIESCASVIRMMIVSVRPPLKPEIRPNPHPSTNMKTTVEMPMRAE